MKKLIITFSSLVLIIALIIGVILFNRQPTPNSNPLHIVCEELSDSASRYYSGEYSYERLSQLNGCADNLNSYTACQNNELYNALQTHMSQTHKNYTVYSGSSKNSLTSCWKTADAYEGKDAFVMFYSDLPSDSELVTLNREHIWAKSKASFNQQLGGSDLHHIRPADEKINSKRSDYTFGYVDKAFSDSNETVSIDDTVAGYTNAKAQLFEPKDDVKGDVARILLYVYCRWGQPNLYSDVEADKLPLPDSDDETNTGLRVIESLDTLLQWCEDDPVDTREMRRNDLTESIQGNRNVFIDYPELAWLMFSLPVPEGLTTPSKQGCNHNFKVTEHKEPSCTEDGYDILNCENCGESRKFIYHKTEHKDKNRDEKCDVCSQELAVSLKLQKVNEFTDGQTVVIYNPACKRALSNESYIYSKLATATAYIKKGLLDPGNDCALFKVQKTDGGYYLINNGKYLTSSPTGNGLFLNSEQNEYSVWYIKPAEKDQTVLIMNKNAEYNGKEQALEYYKGNFTTYSVKDSTAFDFEIYAGDIAID